MVYRVEFELKPATPTLQNTFASGMCGVVRGGEGENELKLGGIGST